MTERENGDGGDYPDGSVGRYVRERWGSAPAPKATRPYAPPVVERDPERAEPPDAAGQATADAAGQATADTPGATTTATQGLPAQGPAPGRYRARPGVIEQDPPGPGAGGDGRHGDEQAAGSAPPHGTGAGHPAGIAPPPPGASDPGPIGGPPGPSGVLPGPSGVLPGQRAPSHRAAATGPFPAARPQATAPGPPRYGGGTAHGANGSAPPPPGSGGSVPDTGGSKVTRTPPRGTGRWTDPGAVAAQEAQQARAEPADLSSARLLRPAKRPPQSGWRRLVYVLSGRTINPGESPVDIRRRELTARVNQPLLGCYKIAMLSLKGGVGKTTMTATLGATFASLRGDRVVAVDANPDRGTLSQKIPLETSATVRHLLRDAQRVRRYTDVRAYTSQGPSRLEVLASEQDPAVSEAYSEDDYRRTVNLLEHFYNIVLTDCGTGLMHSAMYGVLGVADQLIIVSSGSIDGARSASATMDWLDAHGHGDLVKGAVAVINSVHRSSRTVDLDRVEEHFAARCRAVVRVPFDGHLDEGAEIDLDRLEPRTRMALLELAANVADAFDRAPAR